MVMYDPPYCAICGGPFDHVELLDFAVSDENDQYRMELSYDSQVLSPAQSAWIGRFQLLAKQNENGPLLARTLLLDPNFLVSFEGQWQQNDDWFELAPTWAEQSSANETNHPRTRFQDYFVAHAACMKVLNIFLEYQKKRNSPHSPRTMNAFIDACFSRQNESIDLVSDHAAPGSAGIGVPSNWATFQNVEHSHLYFGARRFWTDPWDCVPGSEYLCADPIHEPGTETFISTCLASPEAMCQTLASSTSEQPQQTQMTPSSAKNFMSVPREIFDLIISNLSLRDILRLSSSSRELLLLCDSDFWRSWTVNTHGCWFWELSKFPRSSSDENWRAMLQTLTRSGFLFREEARPYWTSTPGSKDKMKKHRGTDRAEDDLPQMPVGLRNRQRIWMCLESVGTRAEWEIKEGTVRSQRSFLR